MITITSGNLFDSGAEALVNAVNCVGVMGAGIALEFKRRFPENTRAYKEACRDGTLKPGVVLVRSTGAIFGSKYVINVPTKRHWRDPSNVALIRSGLVALRAAVERHGISSVAVPALGCGLGGMRWSDVKAEMVRALDGVGGVEFMLFEPSAPARGNLVVHCKREPYDVYIGRGSFWGNPFSHKKGTTARWMVASREEAIRRYEEWIRTQPEMMARLSSLRGKVLGCWCKPKACHGDVLVRMIKEEADGTEGD